MTTTIETPPQLSESGVLLVGGSSGVGLASAKRLASSGVKRLVLAARNSKRGLAAQKAIEQLGARCLFVEIDALDTGSVATGMETAQEFLQGIDIVVNTTAPRNKPTLFSQMSSEAIGETLTSLALPAMNISHAVLPHMRERRQGNIINVASDAAKTATPGETVIGAAMAAIVMFTRTVAMEEKRYGIRTNVLTPSLIKETGLTDYLMEDDFSGRLFKGAIKRAALGVPDATEIANLITFLCRPESQKITGQAISVNGGISAA